MTYKLQASCILSSHTYFEFNHPRHLPPEKSSPTTHLEFHRTQLIQYVAHTVPNDVPGDFVVRLGCRLDGVPGHVVKCNHVPQHADRLVERTETIVRRVTKPQKDFQNQQERSSNLFQEEFRDHIIAK